jgi:hypothetical protein
MDAALRQESVDMMNALLRHGGTLDAGQEDLVMQNRILLSKSQDDRRARQKAEDELRFVRQKLTTQDKDNEAAKTKLAQLATKVTTLERCIDQKDSVIATLQQTVTQLRQQQVQQQAEPKPPAEPSPTAAAVHRTLSGEFPAGSPSSLGPRRLSVSTMLKDKVTIMQQRRMLEKMSGELQAISQAYESSQMEQEDQAAMNWHRALARGNSMDAQFRPQAKAMITFEGVKRSTRGVQNVLSFKEVLDLKTPEEVYLDSRVKQSAFHEQIQPMREQMMALWKEWKLTTDTSYNAMQFIFGEVEKRGACILTNPKEDFAKELRNAVLKTKKLIFDAMRRMNKGITDILTVERKVKQKWLTEARPSKDAAVEADFAPPEDPRIAALTEKVEFLQSLLQRTRDDFDHRTRDTEMQREKAEINMLFLQQKVFELHQAVYDALHAVYKHRFKWTQRMPNNFLNVAKDCGKKKLLEVHFNVALGEAIDHEIANLRKFGEYIVSDDLFGTDQSGAMKETDSAVTFGRRKDRVLVNKKQIASARRLSSAVTSLLDQEKSVKVSESQGESESSNVEAATDSEAEYPRALNSTARPAFVAFESESPAEMQLAAEKQAADPQPTSADVQPPRRRQSKVTARTSRRPSVSDESKTEKIRINYTPTTITLQLNGSLTHKDPQEDFNLEGKFRRPYAAITRK